VNLEAVLGRIRKSVHETKTGLVEMQNVRLNNIGIFNKSNHEKV
jgi:hypothetical protein